MFIARDGGLRVVRGPGSPAPESRPGDELRQPEVEHLHAATLGQENVRGLDVPMDDALLVRGVQGIRDLDRDAENFVGQHRPASDSVLYGLSFEQFHGDKRPAVVLIYLVDGRDIGMVQGARCPRFALETLESLAVFGHFVRQKL